MRGSRLFTFASGGWVIALAVVIMIMVAVLTMLPQIRALQNRPPGDGRDPSSYGFDLASLSIPEAELAAGMLHRDRVEALVEPETAAASVVPQLNEQRRGKFIVPSDRVIGVVANGAARAYPLRILNVHEAVNDVVGDRPILVTYNPLCDSAAAYDRSNPDAGTPYEFGLSGLVWQSHPLLYDRGAEPGSERLWSQLLGAAVTDPAGLGPRALPRLQVEVTHWSDWRERHPQTTVLIEPKANELDLYKYVDYSTYRRTDDLTFPVAPLPPAGIDWALKTPCIILLEPDGGSRVYNVQDLVDRASADGSVRDKANGVEYVFRALADPSAAVLVEARDSASNEALSANAQPMTIYAYWFAWYALDPAAAVAFADHAADGGEASEGASASSEDGAGE